MVNSSERSSYAQARFLLFAHNYWKRKMNLYDIPFNKGSARKSHGRLDRIPLSDQQRPCVYRKYVCLVKCAAKEFDQCDYVRAENQLGFHAYYFSTVLNYVHLEDQI